MGEGGGVFVVEGSPAVELVVHPLPLVGLAVRLVVERACPVHLVLLPLALVAAPVLVEELPLPVPHPVQFVPFVSAPQLEVLLHVLRGGFGLWGSLGGLQVEFEGVGVEGFGTGGGGSVGVVADGF